MDIGYVVGIIKEEYESLMSERNRICNVVNEMGGHATIDNQRALRRIDDRREGILKSIKLLNLEIKFQEKKNKK